MEVDEFLALLMYAMIPVTLLLSLYDSLRKPTAGRAVWVIASLIIVVWNGIGITLLLKFLLYERMPEPEDGFPLHEVAWLIAFVPAIVVAIPLYVVFWLRHKQRDE